MHMTSLNKENDMYMTSFNRNMTCVYKTKTNEMYQKRKHVHDETLGFPFTDNNAAPPGP